MNPSTLRRAVRRPGDGPACAPARSRHWRGAVVLAAGLLAGCAGAAEPAGPQFAAGRAPLMHGDLPQGLHKADDQRSVQPAALRAASAARPPQPVDMNAFADSIAQLELDVVVLRQNFDVDRASLDRLVAIEGQVQALLADLAAANGETVDAAAGAPPVAAGTSLAELAPPLDLMSPGAAPVATAPPAVEPRAIARPPQAQPLAAGGFATHLASYRSLETLERGWRVLSRDNPDLLSDLSYRVSTLDKNGEVYYRLKAGPLPDEAAARALCSAFKSRKQYCVVTQFAGALPR